ncbi:TerC family protein [Rubrivirga sp. IMCC45206]|uniref:TerC family protein n=1 Tax=Rubrivirga sp. IMCC45206 TaxID=3391614 RepID=UPI0039900983
MFDWIADPNAWVALTTLTMLEIVLGIDNIIFISILTGKLPPEQQAKGRSIGLGLAMGMRILLLISISWVMGLTAVLFDLGDFLPFLNDLEAFGSTARDTVGHGSGVEGGDTSPIALTGRDLILLIGGFFLVGKSVHEIHNKLEGDGEHAAEKPKAVSFTSVLIQIAILDIVFSLDSVITAVGMADDLAVMIIAVVVAVGVMMVGAGPISDFVHKHPTVKMLALAFLILIGVTLIAEGLNQHISKGYIYTAMAFALIVEFLNIRSKRGNDTPSVELIEPHALAGTSGVPDPTQIVRTTHPSA